MFWKLDPLLRICRWAGLRTVWRAEARWTLNEVLHLLCNCVQGQCLIFTGHYVLMAQSSLSSFCEMSLLDAKSDPELWVGGAYLQPYRVWRANQLPGLSLFPLQQKLSFATRKALTSVNIQDRFKLIILETVSDGISHLITQLGFCS